MRPKPATFQVMKEKTLPLLARAGDDWVNVRSMGMWLDLTLTAAGNWLQRLEEAGLVEKRWEEVRGVRQKQYRISPKGLESVAKATN